jgi:biopolymer transport protein ExbD
MPLRRGRRRRRPTAPESLKLTSMMDILTVLLLFLLKSFVVEGEVITPAPGVSLPESTSDTSPESSVVVAILDDRIMLDGRQVAQVASAVADANATGGAPGGDLLIPALAEQLDLSRQQGEAIAARRGDAATYEPRLAIQGDRDIPFAVLQRVMYTCNHSGYGDIALVVLGAS